MIQKTETGWGWARSGLVSRHQLSGIGFQSRGETFGVGIRKEIRQTVLVSESSFDYNLNIVKKERKYG
jgi:hypothetical protein